MIGPRPRGEHGPDGRSRRAAVWCPAALCATALYLVVALVGWPFPTRLLYDGLVPLPPYRWVHPPASRRSDNKPALSGSGTVKIGPPSRATEVATDDDQALVTFAEGAVAPRPGETGVKVTIAPLDPAAIGPPPSGRRFDGNAYRIEAVYAPSGTAAVLASPVTVVLRYPVHSTVLLRSEGQAWESLTPQVFTGSQQILANTSRLGAFAAAALSNAQRADPGRGAPLTALGAALAGLLAAAAARLRLGPGAPSL